MLSVLTPTGDRPDAFADCIEMMRAQDYRGPVRWVVVDDGHEMTPTPEIEGWEVVHLRPFPRWRKGQNTQARNLLIGLHHVTDRVVVVEDDDSYAPWWLSRCDAWLDAADLVGEAPSLYRHLNGREKNMGNTEHASLCSTALKGPAIADLRRVCREQLKFIDMRLWRDFAGSKRIHPPEPRGVVGIKGRPGRPGIGIGHRL